MRSNSVSATSEPSGEMPALVDWSGGAGLWGNGAGGGDSDDALAGRGAQDAPSSAGGVDQLHLATVVGEQPGALALPHEALKLSETCRRAGGEGTAGSGRCGGA